MAAELRRVRLDWAGHSGQLITGVSDLLKHKTLLDVTLSAEGKQIRAHKVILASASSYFRVS